MYHSAASVGVAVATLNATWFSASKNEQKCVAKTWQTWLHDLPVFFRVCIVACFFIVFYEQKTAFLVGRVLEKIMQQLMPNLMPSLMPNLMPQFMLELMPLGKNLMQQLMPNLMPNLRPQLMPQLMLELDCGPSTMIDFNMVRVASGLS